jgi:hypothetical protein
MNNSYSYTPRNPVNERCPAIKVKSLTENEWNKKKVKARKIKAGSNVYVPLPKFEKTPCRRV